MFFDMSMLTRKRLLAEFPTEAHDEVHCLRAPGDHMQNEQK